MIDDSFDIFYWANQVDFRKSELDVELFFFSKNYTPYLVSISDKVREQLLPLFLYDHIHQLQLDGAIGMQVRDYETSEPVDNTLLSVELEKVDRANTLIYLIESERSDILQFSEVEHEVKRMAGIVARFSDPSGEIEPFYVVKQLETSKVLNNRAAWEMNGDTLSEMSASVCLKIPTDNQVLIVGERIFAFKPGKFVKLFKFDPAIANLIRTRSEYLTKQYSLVFPEGLSMNYIAESSKKVSDMLVKLDGRDLPSIDAVVDHAEEMDLALMTDENGSIIIMDTRDAAMLLNIIADNYVDSNLTGLHYLVKNKQRIDTDSQMNMNI